MDQIFLAISTLFFLGGFFYSVMSLLGGGERPGHWNIGAMVAGFAFQNLFLWQRGLVHGRCPVTNLVELLIFLSWAMVIFYLIFGPTYRLSLLGVFTAPLVFVVQVLGLLVPFDREAALARAAARDPVDGMVEMHISVSLLAYGAFAMAFVAGVMFLVQDRQIRRKNLNTLFYNLPPVGYLAKAILRLIVLGCVLLTAGIVSAYFIDESVLAGHPLKLLYVIWAIYAGIGGYALWKGMAASRLAKSSVVAFLFPLISLWVVSTAH